MNFVMDDASKVTLRQIASEFTRHLPRPRLGPRIGKHLVRSSPPPRQPRHSSPTDSSLSDPILFRSKLRAMLRFQPGVGFCFLWMRHSEESSVNFNVRGVSSSSASDNFSSHDSGSSSDSGGDSGDCNFRNYMCSQRSRCAKALIPQPDSYCHTSNNAQCVKVNC